jgi:predicted nucleotidyltransferase
MQSGGKTALSPIVKALFGDGAKGRVVQWLYTEADPREAYPARALARAAGIPYGSAHKTLKELAIAQLVSTRQTPRGIEYAPPVEDPRLKHLFLLLRQDSALVRSLQRRLRALKATTYACIFGSFARGQTHATSDIDVLILGAVDEWATRTALQAVALKSKREINPQFLSVQEFLRDLEKGEAVARSILASPRIDLIGEAPWPT